MATKKKEKPLEDTSMDTQIDILNSIAKSINKEFGADTTVMVDDDGALDRNIKDYIMFGVPVVDYIIGKGVPSGRINEIYGEPSSGKTALAMHLLKTTIDRGGLAFMLDSEAAFSFDMAKKIGMNIQRLAYSTPRTLEEIWRQIEHITTKVKELAGDKLTTIVVDSIAAAPSEKEIANDIGKAEMGERARINSKGLRKITVDILDNSICLLFINQVRKNIGQMFGDTDLIPGGSAIDFHASTKIRVRKGPVIMDPLRKDLAIGQVMRLKVTKNKTAPPFKKAEIELYFDFGIPKYSGVVSKLVAEKVISKKTTGTLVFKDEKFKEGDIVQFMEAHPYLLDFNNLDQYKGEVEDE
jgi:recombination protein RecA